MEDSTRHKRRGFSLLEALFAIALLFGAIATFLALFPYAIANNQHDSYYLQAVTAGQQYLDALRSAAERNQPQPTPVPVAIDAGYSIVDLYGKTQNQSPGYFQIAGGCQGPPPLSTLLYCSVTVTWWEGANQTNQRTYTTESFATQQVQ